LGIDQGQESPVRLARTQFALPSRVIRNGHEAACFRQNPIGMKMLEE